jgi:lipoprotein-releasing system permease protein
MTRLLSFEWIIAIRFLREGLVQTLLIVTGASVGVGVIVFMSILMTGLQGNFLKRVLNTQAHIVLIRPDEVARPQRVSDGALELAIVEKPIQRLMSLDQWQKTRDQMVATPGVTVVAPAVSGAAFLIRGDVTKAVTLTGVEPENYFKIVRIPDDIVTGKAALTTQGILIGVDLASDLGVLLGDKINVAGSTGHALVLTVGGIFDLGNKNANQKNVFVALRTAQSLIGLIGGATSINLTVSDIYAAETIAQSIAASTGTQADSWIKTNQQFFVAINAQNVSTTVIELFVSLSVAFGIASVLIVSVVQRSREVGILRAMGASKGQILRVFLIQGGVVGLAGSIGGTALGLGFLTLWHAFARNADGSEIFPIVMDVRLMAATGLLATVVGIAAAAMPASRAAGLDPVEAIRG